MSNTNLKEIISKINKDGIVAIDNFIDDNYLAVLQKYILNEIQNQPKGYVGCVGKKNLRGSPLENIDIDRGIKNILDMIHTKCFGNKIPNKNLYQVLRVLSGDRQGLKQAYMFHYDAYALTALLPIIIPDREDGKNGDFLYFMQRRNLHKNLIRNIIEKFLIQNKFIRFLLSKKFIQRSLGMKVCQLKPGKLYIFWGFQTIHGNALCSHDSPRATALFHYSDPFDNNFLVKNIEKMNVLRTNINIKRKKS